MPSDQLECLTPPELAKRWRCSPDRVLALIRRGFLEAFTLSVDCQRPRYRVPLSAVLAYESGRKVTPSAKRRPRKDSGVVEYF
jgi:hypothetical protein